MKKILMIVILTVFAVVFAACSNSDNENDAKNNETMNNENLNNNENEQENTKNEENQDEMELKEDDTFYVLHMKFDEERLQEDGLLANFGLNLEALEEHDVHEVSFEVKIDKSTYFIDTLDLAAEFTMDIQDRV